MMEGFTILKCVWLHHNVVERLRFSDFIFFANKWENSMKTYFIAIRYTQSGAFEHTCSGLLK